MCLTGGSLVSAMGENEVISREARALGERNVVGKSKSIKVGHKSRDNHIIHPKYDFQIVSKPQVQMFACNYIILTRKFTLNRIY